MKATQDWVLVKPYELDELPSGLQLPNNQHPYAVEVVSVGEAVTATKKGDKIIPSSNLGWFNMNNTTYTMLKESQAAIVCDQEDLQVTADDLPEDATENSNGKANIVGIDGKDL